MNTTERLNVKRNNENCRENREKIYEIRKYLLNYLHVNSL